MKTIICGVDARLVAVHVLDRLSDVEPSAKSATSPSAWPRSRATRTP